MKRIALFLIFLLALGSRPTLLHAEDQVAKAPPLPSGEITYNAPKEWVKERPAGAMRKAQFKLPGANGAGNALLTVNFFKKTGGTVERNIERWSGQFKNADGTPVKAPLEKKQIQANGIPITEVYFSGTYLESMGSAMMGAPAEEKPGYAMLGAIAETADGPWFFKATGPKATIDNSKEAFEKFLATFTTKK
jgi:hypothetical protein